MKSFGIEENIKEIVKNFSKESFICDFLTAFGFTKMTVKRLKEGNSNLALKENQLIIKQKIFYEYIDSDDIYNIIDNLKNDPKTYTHKPRFIIVNNSEKFLAYLAYLLHAALYWHENVRF